MAGHFGIRLGILELAEHWLGILELAEDWLSILKLAEHWLGILELAEHWLSIGLALAVLLMPFLKKLDSKDI